jgi:dTDP-4-dehydrorhamnose 3,5-epimerase
MDVQEFKIKELKLIIPKRFGDARGYFHETWSDRAYRDVLGEVEFVQEPVFRLIRSDGFA